MFNTETVKIVGGANNRWGQVYAEDAFFLLLEIEGIEQAAEIGHRIIEKVRKGYEELEEKNLNSIKKLFRSLKTEGKLTLMVGVLAEDILYLLGQGEGEVLLKRKEACSKVLSGQGSSSGILEDEDVVVFFSPTFKRLVPSWEIKERLGTGSLREIEEYLASRVQGADENEGAAGLLVRFSQIDKKKRESKLKKLTNKIFTKIKPWVDFLKNHQAFQFKEKLRIEKGRRLTASVGLILTILLFVSLVLGNFQKERTAHKEEIKKLKEEVSPQIQEGEALLELNVFQARRVLSEAKNSLEAALSTFKNKSKEREEAEKLLEEVNRLLALAQKNFRLDQAPVFFDLAWIKEGASGSSLALYKDSLVVLDGKTGSVYQFSLTSKKSQILGAGQALVSAFKIAVHGEEAFIMLTGKEAKIINPKGEVVIENDKEWQEIIDIAAYAGNLYLLDKGGAIWKYPQTETGFGARRDYLAKDIKPDFSWASSISIDGAVWVLNGGRVTKFLAGVPESFSLQEFEEDLKEPIDFFTNEESKNIYLLDKEGKIVIFDKEGRYHAQYSWARLSQITDFVVSESLQKILVLLDGKLYAIEIK